MTHDTPLLPTLDELLHPDRQPEHIRSRAAASTDPLDPIHLFDMHWRGTDGDVEHRVLPPALTGCDAPIVVMSGRRFPTGSHKVGPAYSCAREALLDGRISPDGSTLVFPSTGNYGIGGAWVGPRLGFDSLVVLPEGMSRERFEKIRAFGADIIATPGTESNVKEIYDKVAELRTDPRNKILNQFEELGNYRFHHHVTGGSAAMLADVLEADGVGCKVAAFVSAMGSAGTIAAADRLQQDHPGCKVVGVEPVQCPTMYNVGYGAHAIEGIGDKHVTWIHHVRNMDLLWCIDDQSCLEVLQLVEHGRDALAGALELDVGWLASLQGVFGISGICNVLASILTARHYGFGAGEMVFTVATDGFDRYPSVMAGLTRRHGPQTPDVARRRIDLLRAGGANHRVLEGTQLVRRRWHNQKYFTWVEQQGRTVAELEAQWDHGWWRAEAARVAEYDAATLAWRRRG